MRAVSGHQDGSNPALEQGSYPDDSLRWQSFVSSVRSIPVLADSVYRLSNLLMIAPVDLAAVSEVMRTDVGLAAQILKLVNSGIAEMPIHDLDTAIVHLGVEPIRAFILTVPVLPSDGPTPVLRLWEHSRECAQICAWLAETLEQQPSRAYIAGLLHDLGRIPLIAWALATQPLSSVQGAELVFTSPEQENSQFGINHQVIGGWMAVTWDFPDFLVDGAEQHHSVNASTNSDLVNLVRAADKFSYFWSGVAQQREVLAALAPIAIHDNEEQLLVRMNERFRSGKPRCASYPNYSRKDAP
jgi:HD-like signal output (HDOD) protein